MKVIEQNAFLFSENLPRDITPRDMDIPPNSHCRCADADVMQHFSNPVIATNEWINI